ncbi:hypothetical protein [Rheinheimera sp.]|uniref:hypothetical protein n=1 Tax=Rheinheimera sp. TaxID=1869214 RepID=UPI0037C7CC5C
MPIFKGYETPCDLLAKLLREGRRVNFSGPGPDDIYDHLFNFCVTAHSLRDWCIKYLGLTAKAKEDFGSRCNKSVYLEYAKDIANSSKHFTLSQDRTSSVDTIAKSSHVMVAMGLDGKLLDGHEQTFSSANICLPEREPINSYLFVASVVIEWQRIFDEYSVPKDDRANLLILVSANV